MIRNLLLLCFILNSFIQINADEDIKSLLSVSRAFRNVAKSVTPSVVTVETIYDGDLDDEEVHPYFRFFGPQDDSPAKGAGSGIIYDAKGHIITNNHVIEGASEIEVVLSDGTRVEADLVGTDPQTDLAVIRFTNYQEFNQAKIGDSDKIQVGDWAIAIGNPLGFSHTVTHGIISAKGRSGLRDASEEAYENFIQTDAAINQGNSGGALCNIYGEIIGVNSMIASQSGGSQGLGFAIPINMAKRIVDQLIEKGEIQRGFLGVMIKDVNRMLADQFDYNGHEGALVDQVEEGSPAEEAGIQIGDIILEVEGKKIKNIAMLRNKVSEYAPGTEVELEIYRNGKKELISATLGLRGGLVEGGAHTLGIKVRPLTEEELEDYPTDQGWLITEVEDNSPGMNVGLQENMVISTIDRKPVKTLGEFRSKIRESLNDDDGGVLLYVYTQKHGFFVVVNEE